MSTVDSQGATDPAALVAVHGLAKHFNKRCGIEGLSLTLCPGEVFGLIGANGGGKTTALRMLAGLLKPDAGSGTVLGHDLLTGATHFRNSVGYMAQSFAMYPTLTVLENIRFRAEVFAVANPRLATSQLIERFSLGSVRDVAAGKLSGGWARLLQLAASLVHRPQLVLLDEPTAGLDSAHRYQVWRHIMSLAHSGAAVVLSTHDLAEAERCTQLLLLARGSVCAHGTAMRMIETASARAFRVQGAAALALAEPLARLPQVLAVYPQGNGLHLVVRPAGERSVQEIIAAHGCEHTEVELNFEDAATALTADDRAPAHRAAA